MRDGTTQSGAAWRPPFWTEAAGAAGVMLDTPLKYNDEYLGMLAQVVPIAEISSALGELELPSGMTPFVLYGRTRVLAHPTMINWKPEVIGDEVPLPALASFGDIALRRIWTPDEDSIFQRTISCCPLASSSPAVTAPNTPALIFAKPRKLSAVRVW